MCNYWLYSTYVMYSEISEDLQVNTTSPLEPEDTVTMKLSVYFSDLNYEEYQEQLLTDGNGFLANLGGVVGLWTGISIVSVAQCLAILLFGPCEDNPGFCGLGKGKL